MINSKEAPLWMWVLRLIGGLFIFIILDGIAQLPGTFFKSPVPIIIGSIVLSALVLLAYYGWIGLTEGQRATDLPSLFHHRGGHHDADWCVSYHFVRF